MSTSDWKKRGGDILQVYGPGSCSSMSCWDHCLLYSEVFLSLLTFIFTCWLGFGTESSVVAIWNMLCKWTEQFWQIALIDTSGEWAQHLLCFTWCDELVNKQLTSITSLYFAVFTLLHHLKQIFCSALSSLTYFFCVVCCLLLRRCSSLIPPASASLASVQMWAHEREMFSYCIMTEMYY